MVSSQGERAHEGLFLGTDAICGDSLTLGLMGLDELHLRVLSTSSDDPKERRNATKGGYP